MGGGSKEDVVRISRTPFLTYPLVGAMQASPAFLGATGYGCIYPNNWLSATSPE